MLVTFFKLSVPEANRRNNDASLMFGLELQSAPGFFLLRDRDRDETRGRSNGCGEEDACWLGGGTHQQQTDANRFT